MRAVIISDVHIGRYKYGRVDPNTGIDTRTQDILKNISEAISYAIEKKCEHFFILGDCYHTKRPLNIFRKMFVSKVAEILKTDMHLFILLGNHDQGKTLSHDLVELHELSGLVNKLHIIEKPLRINTADAMLAFLPHVNKVECNLMDNEYKDFFISKIRKMTELAKASDKKYKLFFGHFGTDKSTVGTGMDLGEILGQTRTVPLAEFKKDAWTRVFLGDIHKPQTLNDFCMHIGSIAITDFGEEGEEKGFVYFDDGKVEFIKIHDRKFRTLEVDLTDTNYAETINDFFEAIKAKDLTQCIVRIKAKLRYENRKLINFNPIEAYLRENSWCYVGKNLTEIKDNKEIKFDEVDDLNFLKLFKDYVAQLEDKFEPEVIKAIISEGEKLLSEELTGISHGS